MSQSKYFDKDEFITSVIQAMRLGQMPAEVMLEFRDAVEERLSERIMSTVIENFGTNDLKLFEKMLVDHTELDEIDALMMIAPQVKGLDVALKNSINSLHSELVYDAEKIEEALKKETVSAV